MPKFKAMEKPAFLSDIHPEEDNEAIVIPRFINTQAGYKFLSDS